MSPIRTRPFTFPRRLIIGTAILCATVAALTYVLFQARFLIEGPQIMLTNDPSVVQNERQVVLEGIAENITAITLNGRSIVTNESGTFKEKVILENGYTLVRIEARDRYGRATALERPFVYISPESEVSLVQ